MNKPSTSSDQAARRNRKILFGQSSVATMGWTLANPSVLLVFLAIAHDVPVFLAGLLVTVRHGANLTTTTLGSEFAAGRLRKKHDLAASDFTLATCYLFALAAVAFGTSPVITIAFILVVATIGFAEEYQSLINYDFLPDVLRSQDRKQLVYTAMIVGGIGSLIVILPIHQWLLHEDAFRRHSAILLISIVCFCFSAAALMLIRESFVAPSGRRNPVRRNKSTPGAALRQYWSNLRQLWTMNWFRRYLIVRLSLQTIEMSIPFFAILAALSHGASHKGLTALIISSALALIVAAPLWRSLSEVSNRFVMLTGALLAASSGLLLVLNHLFGFTSTILVHAVALFCVTVAVQGVQTARSLFYMDIAPKTYRVRGVAASKSVTRISGIALSIAMAALAHMQHVIWAIAFLAICNVVSAGVAFASARPLKDSPAQP